MNPCKNCVVDMICIKECPLFEIDLDRLQTDELVYLNRCVNNIKRKTYEISEDVIIEIRTEGVYWFKNNKRHRDNDKPAIIFYSGTKYWYKNDEIHRDNDQPAVIHTDGEQYWYKDGKIHRDNDQPAVTRIDGTQSWYKNGVRYEFV